MNEPQFAMDYGGDAPAQSGAIAVPQQVAAAQPFQIVMPPQKKRFSAGAGMVAGVILSAAALYVAETFAPPAFRPSTFTGSYGGRVEAEIKAHDLETQAKFLDWAEEVKVSVAQQQDQYRNAAQGILNNYQAAYDRTRIYAQATAQLQQNYMQQRTEIAREQQGTDVFTINFARIWGRISNVLDEGSGDAALDYADSVGEQLQDELTDAVQNGVTVDVAGWDTNLPSPQQVRGEFDKLPPIKFPDPPKISRDALSEAGE